MMRQWNEQTAFMEEWKRPRPGQRLLVYKKVGPSASVRLTLLAAHQIGLGDPVV